MKFSTWLRAEWDRVAGFTLVGLGALFVLLGYLGVRESAFVAEQMAYIASGGIGGLFCLGFGVGLLVTADLHDEWRKLDRLEAAMRAAPEPEPDGEPEHGVVLPAGPGASDGPGRTLTPQVVGTNGGTVTMPFTGPAGGSRTALAVVALIVVVPLAVAGAGWRRASQTGDLDVAAGGLGVAVAAVAVGFAVVSVWALWMRTSVLRRLAVVTRGLRHRVRPAAGAPRRSAFVGGEHTVFVADGHRRFHRAGCPMLGSIEAAPRPREGLEAGMSACGLCAAP